MNSASNSEIASTTITTAPSGHQKLPVTPGMNSSGMKATMLVRILKVTGPAISRAPCTAASMKLMPCSRYS